MQMGDMKGALEAQHKASRYATSWRRSIRSGALAKGVVDFIRSIWGWRLTGLEARAAALDFRVHAIEGPRGFSCARIR